jgi:5-methylcytosine-specific restriction endonuclease McrA
MKSHTVLVLNADYRAFTVISIYKAFLLLYLNKAEMVQKSAERNLRTVTKTFDAPSIIRLNNYVNRPYKGVMLSRQNVFKRDGNACVYCGTKKDLTLDHVMPSSRGGGSGWHNLVTACKQCNSRKGDRTPEEANMPMRIRPFKPSFVMFLRDFSTKHDHHWNDYL